MRAFLLGPSMYLIDVHRIESALGAALEVCDAPEVYLEPGNYAGHASIDAMLSFTQGKYDIPIHLWDVTFEGRITGSRIERYNDRIEISIQSGQDERWKRFCSAKELIHLLIDGQEDVSPYGHDRIDELLAKGLIGLASGVNPTGNPTQSELVAEIAAIEILYPSSQIIMDLAALENNGEDRRLNVRRVGLERQMPDFYASTALNPAFRQYVQAAMEQCQKTRKAT